MNKYRQFAITCIKNKDLPISVLENITEKILGAPERYIIKKNSNKKNK